MPYNGMDTVLVAVDTTDINTAIRIVQTVAPYGVGLKFGLEFFNTHGGKGITHVLSEAQAYKACVFSDLKFHDIPNTVAGAVRGLYVSGVHPAIFNVHAAGGLDMMRIAKHQSLECSAKVGCVPPLVIGVTIMTALNQSDITQIGYTSSLEQQTLRMAELAKSAGLDGVVCSAHEVALIKSVCGQDFKTIVPGIRPTGAMTDDQKRIMSPQDALRAGADYIVIGRPITHADDMGAVLDSTRQDLECV